MWRVSLQRIGWRRIGTRMIRVGGLRDLGGVRWSSGGGIAHNHAWPTPTQTDRSQSVRTQCLYHTGRTPGSSTKTRNVSPLSEILEWHRPAKKRKINDIDPIDGYAQDIIPHERVRDCTQQLPRNCVFACVIRRSVGDCYPSFFITILQIDKNSWTSGRATKTSNRARTRWSCI